MGNVIFIIQNKRGKNAWCSDPRRVFNNLQYNTRSTNNGSIYNTIFTISDCFNQYMLSSSELGIFILCTIRKTKILSDKFQIVKVQCLSLLGA